ncbi:MAG: transporter substrate-binding domain-containing protein [Rickettsiales bacterium]|nr:MAG: transporter substrate-binding domain-containing protein [Rickettsiales bacterium]
MKKIMSLVVVLLLNILILADVKAAEISVATAAIKYPVMYVNEKNEIVGCEPELATAVLKKLGYDKINFVDIGFDGLIPSLTSGKVDIIASGLSITEARKKMVDYSDPYVEVGSKIYIRNSEKKVKSISDLKDKKLGTTIGTVQSDYAEKMEKEYGYKLVVFTTTDDMFADLAKEVGGIDAVIENEASAKAYIEKTKMKIKAVGKTLNPTQWAFGFRKSGQEEMIAKVNKALAELKKAGVIKKIYKKCI